MTQQEFNTQLLKKVKPKGWFLTFLLNKILPWLWENRDEVGDLFRKEKPKANKLMDGIGPDKPDPGTTPDPPM